MLGEHGSRDRTCLHAHDRQHRKRCRQRTSAETGKIIDTGNARYRSHWLSSWFVSDLQAAFRLLHALYHDSPEKASAAPILLSDIRQSFFVMMIFRIALYILYGFLVSWFLAFRKTNENDEDTQISMSDQKEIKIPCIPCVGSCS